MEKKLKEKESCITEKHNKTNETLKKMQSSWEALNNRIESLRKVEEDLKDREQTIDFKEQEYNLKEKSDKIQMNNILLEKQKLEETKPGNNSASQNKYLESKYQKDELNIKKKLIYDKIKDVTDLDGLQRVIEFNDELKDVMSTGALKLEMFDKKERMLKNKERESKDKEIQFKKYVT